MLHKLQLEMSNSDDAEYEELAIKAKSSYENVSIDNVQDLLFPVTIGFPDRRCVELRPRSGVVGGTNVYCFAERSKRLIAHYQIME